MLATNSPLERAVEAITIADVWHRLDLPGEPKKSSCSPFRDDRKPSFSIFADDRRFIDFGTGEKGDVIDFIMKATGMDRSAAAKQLIEWHKGYSSYSPTGSFQRGVSTSQRSLKHAEKERKKLVIPDVDRGSIEELNALSTARGLPVFAAIELLYERGLFGFCNVDGNRCWVLFDSAKRNAQVRPLYPDKAGWGKKAKSLPGSNASWPIGADDIKDKEIVFLTEGPPDLLAAATVAWWETNSRDFERLGFCSMTGARQTISRDALPLFEGKTVRILIDNDPGGLEGASKWWKQLDPYAVQLEAWMSDREGEDLNDYVRRCWEEMPENQTQWLPFKITSFNKEPDV
ncbi:MAG: CHC2 zinc finger domain-containing protein [Verrucomicrobia bacterium]|nr:CHC2 zinc finger domain-containing protein [Verrucomicrobiota bacterium]